VPVNLPVLQPADLLPVPGVRLGVAEAGIRKANRRDLTLIELAAGSRAAGVFTLNRFCAAPVQLCKQHLPGGRIQALVINTGVANAGTGEQGLANAHATCVEAGRLLGIAPEQVLPFSTGVILEPLPVDSARRRTAGGAGDLRADGWFDAAHAIMTTDTGRGRVAPDPDWRTHRDLDRYQQGRRHDQAEHGDDARLSRVRRIGRPAAARFARQRASEVSFNSITIDGDTSTNDSFIVIATGQAATKIADPLGADFHTLREAVIDVSIRLAQAIVRDGEGATKFIHDRVEGGVDRDECRKVAYADRAISARQDGILCIRPQPGRILAAIGYAGITDLDVDRLRVWLGAANEEVLVAERGGRRRNLSQEDGGARVMKESEITIRVDLARGQAGAIVWTCDFSYDYVKINADYRS